MNSGKRKNFTPSNKDRLRSAEELSFFERLHYIPFWLSNPNCPACCGSAYYRGDRDGYKLCECFCRTIARRVIRVAREIESTRPGVAHFVAFMKSAEYMAEISLVARRVLTPLEYWILDNQMIRELGWQYCCRRTRLDRGNLFHAVYRIEAKLGEAIAAAGRDSIYPAGRYFGRAHWAARPG